MSKCNRLLQAPHIVWFGQPCHVTGMYEFLVRDSWCVCMMGKGGRREGGREGGREGID